MAVNLDELQFYSSFKSISVISCQWKGDNEVKLCAVDPIYDRIY